MREKEREREKERRREGGGREGASYADGGVLCFLRTFRDVFLWDRSVGGITGAKENSKQFEAGARYLEELCLSRICHRRREGGDLSTRTSIDIHPHIAKENKCTRVRQPLPRTPEAVHLPLQWPL